MSGFIMAKQNGADHMQSKVDHYKALFEAVGDALFVMTRGKILDCNSRTLDLFGYQRSEFIGCHPAQLSPAEQVNGELSTLKTAEYFDRAFSGECLTFDWLFRRFDKTLFEAEVTISPVTMGDEKSLIASVRQTDVRHNRWQELLETEIKAQQNQKMESLGLMAGGIAHDFNNFLLAIMGNADLLDQDLSPGMDGQVLLDEIRLAANRAADMCNQLMAFSGKGQCSSRAVDLSTISREMVRMLQIGIPNKVTLRLDLAENLPCIEADASQLHQLIMNLVVNASEAIGRSEGTISLSTGEHFTETDRFDHCLCSETFGGTRQLYVQVSDTGSGMDRETMQRICDPFFSSKVHSRGLGLASVLGVVRAHQGALCIRSKPGQGACVRACFPLVEATVQPTPVPVPAMVADKGRGLVLVVDDEEFLRILCGRMLGRLGYDVVLAASGHEALDIYRVRSEEIVCVMLDLIMPGMDGVEVHEKIKAMNPDARVIVTSGYHQQEIATRFEGKGMSGFIQKPYRIAALEKIVGSVVSRPSQREGVGISTKDRE